MDESRLATVVLALLAAALLVPYKAGAQQSTRDSSSSSSVSSAHHVRKSGAAAASGVDAGLVSNGSYRNKTLAFSCKIPAGWVLRTDELNASEDDEAVAHPSKSAKDSGAQGVLFAAFARPPQARGEDVNSSILIANESVSAYPGLKDAAQYFGPVSEVAKAQGFAIDDEPYEFEIGSKAVVRADFQKDVGSRVMRQSTLVILSHGYAVSFTFIGGTEDEVEELIDGLSFAGTTKPQSR